MNNYTIYMHKNKINGKIYIGQTSQEPKKRWDNGRGYIDCSRFYNAILKYGWNNFEHIILYQNLSQKQANILEEQLIKQYNTQNDKYGYNIKAGGNNKHHTEETKRKIGKANSKALKGNKWSQHQHEIMSKMFMGKGNPFYGKHHTEETKRKISESRKGKCIGEEHPMYGKHHSKENLEKISKNRQGKGGKQVLCIETGEIFNCMMDAARRYGLKTSAGIGQCCIGKAKSAGKHPVTNEPLHWKFV